MNARLATLMIALLGTHMMGMSATRQISLDEAIDIALKQNKNVAIARIAVNKADAQVKEALGYALPTISLNANFNRNILAPVFFLPNFEDPSAGLTPVRLGLDNAYGVNAQLSQIIFNGAVFSGIGASQVYADAAKAQFKASVAEVVTETKRRYYGALAAREFVNISRSTLGNAEENYKSIDALFKEGLVAEFDQIRAGVTVDNIRPTVTESESGYANAVSALMQYLALDLADTVEPAVSSLADPTSIPAEDTSIVRALKENYNLIALQLTMETLEQVVDVHRADYYPTLSLVGAWSNQGQSDNFNTWTSASAAYVGLGFSFNIFSGLRTMAKVEQAQADFQTVQQQYELTKDLIRLQVRSVINKLNSAKQRIDAQLSTVSQAQRGYDISRIRYTEGTGSLLEMNDAEFALARARVNRLTALLDYYSTRADYDKTVGLVEPKYLRMAE